MAEIASPLGRITPPASQWPAIAAQIACAPEATDEGPTPTKSLPLFRWRHPRHHAQLAGWGYTSFRAWSQAEFSPDDLATDAYLWLGAFLLAAYYLVTAWCALWDGLTL